MRNKMSFDLEILVRGRKKVKPFNFEKIRMETGNSHSKNMRYRYGDTFLFYASMRGVRCSLYEANTANRYLSAFHICCINPKEISEINYPFWTDESERSGMYVLKIRDGYVSDFKKALTYLWQQSPKKSILFLPRLQGGEYNNVCGVITLNRFFELLSNDKILFNVVYIIQG